MSRRFAAVDRARGRSHWMVVEIIIWSGVAVMSMVGLGLLTAGLMIAVNLRG